ncbi:MAG: glycosyltransferase [Patescibacteria group bacterium]|mgnify:FL=1
MKKVSLAKSNAVIVIHEETTGLAYDLRDYLLKQGIRELLFIAHPLLYLKKNFKNSSRYEFYRDSKLVKSHTAFHWILPEPLLYIKDFLYTVLWCMTIGSKYRLFFGVGNLNAFSGYVLKLLSRVDKVIYYVIDYVPQRFYNKLLNTIYHKIEKFCAQHSDWTWNLSPRMIQGRSKKWNMKFPNQLIVPHGVNFNRIKRVSFENINKREIIYMGTILRKQGIQLVINSLPQILKKIPEIRFTIIGKGPYETELKKLIKKLRLEKYVEFLGYIRNHKDVENRIAKAALAIALYDRRYDEFSYYADPGKIKNYLGAGVPVIMTDVPYVAEEIAKNKCGFIVQYSKKDLLDILLKFFSDKKLMKEYRYNAVRFAKKYDWDKVFASALTYLNHD